MKVIDFINKILKKLGIVKPLFYINGPETLPEPLSIEQEQDLLNEKGLK